WEVSVVAEVKAKRSTTFSMTCFFARTRNDAEQFVDTLISANPELTFLENVEHCTWSSTNGVNIHIYEKKRTKYAVFCGGDEAGSWITDYTDSARDAEKVSAAFEAKGTTSWVYSIPG